jgi:hypothetical protein
MTEECLRWWGGKKIEEKSRKVTSLMVAGGLELDFGQKKGEEKVKKVSFKV